MKIPKTKKVKDDLGSRLSDVSASVLNYVNKRIGSKAKKENIGSNVSEKVFGSDVNSEASSRVPGKELPPKKKKAKDKE